MITRLSFRYRVVLLIQVYISLTVSLSEYVPYDTLYSSPTGQILGHSNVSLSLICTKNVTMLDALAPLNQTRLTKDISVGFCPPPEKPYLETFAALNVDASTLETLVIFFKYNLPLPPGNYMQGLRIRTLSMINSFGDDILRNTKNFLEPLHNVTNINVENILLPPLPESMRLKKLYLSKNSALLSWGNCRYLQELTVSHLTTLEFPRWPENCTSLIDLKIDYMSPEAVRRIEVSMIASAGFIRSLTVSYCRLREVPNDFLRLAGNLTHLDISNNDLYDESFTSFPTLKSLEFLDMSSNPASGYFLENVLDHMPALQKLKLNNNENLKFTCEKNEGIEKSLMIALDTLQQLPIKSISLSATDVDLRCLRNATFSKLEYLYLYSGTPREELRVLDLPKSNAPHLEVDFGYDAYANFEKVHFNETDYEKLRLKSASLSETNSTSLLTVVVRYIGCDCENAWLIRALRNFPNVLSMPKLLCGYEYGDNALEVPVDDLECTKWSDHDGGCVYRARWRDNASFAICEANQYPVLNESVYGLNASGSQLTQLYNELPDTLQWVDVSHNRISRANSTAASALFAAGRRVWLGGNLIVCDCDNRPLLDAIAQHHAQIGDYDNLTCVDSDIPLSMISTYQLCQTALKVSGAIAGFIVGLALVAGVLFRKYGEEIKMFLYSRGYCRSFFTKQELDDRPFDAFLSYAHADEVFVKEHLLPGLESTPERYRVCVHHRDWVVGDWIPAQIMRSVSLAKRTVILLSTNFVKSMWSSLEFRYATAHAAKDQRCRVLVLILDNVLEEPLDPELVAYLYYNTYLRCDDPWFWEKLRYAMPHKMNKECKTRGAEDFDVRAREEGVNMTTLHSGQAMINQPNPNNQN